MKTKLAKKLISCFSIACLSLSLGGIAAGQEQLPPPPGCNCKTAQPPEFEPGGPPPEREKQITESLNQLVSSGKISTEQSASILSFFQQKNALHKAEFEKLKTMSQEEREAFFRQHQPPAPPDIITDLQQAASLSLDQAKLVADTLRPRHPHPPLAQRAVKVLENLVASGTIDADQSAKLLNFFQEKDAQHKADFEKIEAMTAEEREVFFQQHRPPAPPDMIKDLQQAAQLNLEQAKVVSEALRPPRHRGPYCNPCAPTNK